MKKTKICPNCTNTYDGLNYECPHCHTVNDDADADTLKNYVVYPWYKQLSLFLGGFLGFQVLGLIISTILYFFQGEEGLSSAFVNFGAYFLTFIGLVCITLPQPQKLIETFKRGKPYLIGLAGFGVLMVFTILYANVLEIAGLGITDNENESGLQSIIGVYPVLSLLIFGVVGPICEELTYRVGIFSLLRRVNRPLAYVLSALIFALIHFNIPIPFETGAFINELINIPNYLFAGLVMGFLYDHYGLAASLSAHVYNNVYAIVASIIAPYLGI